MSFVTSCSLHYVDSASLPTRTLSVPVALPLEQLCILLNVDQTMNVVVNSDGSFLLRLFKRESAIYKYA